MRQAVPSWTPKTTPTQASTTPTNMVGAIAVDYTMPVITIKITNKYISNVLIDRGAHVHILTDTLTKHLGFPKPKLVTYNIKMVDQSTTMQVGLLENINIEVEGMLYQVTIFVMSLASHNDTPHYSILLGKPWLVYAKVVHDWKGDQLVIQGLMGSRRMKVNRKLPRDTPWPQVLLMYNWQDGLTEKEKDKLLV